MEKGPLSPGTGAVNDPGPLAATAQDRAVPGHPPWASHSRGKTQGRNAATEFINI